MRRSSVWFLIAGLWFVITAISTVRRIWPLAALQGVVALVFLLVGVLTRHKETIR
ncbi:MAG TPA: hypothetical protein VFA02_04495 [Pseudacidobacterium sp.]|nr:hypothetical protein [Pseudacidobacterium sp.]